jgi:hypothetical protein
MKSVGLNLVLLLILTTATGSSAQSDLKVRVNAWIKVSQATGRVTLSSGGNQRPVQVNDLLQAVGDGLVTAALSTANLALDTGIGTIDVSPNTNMRIQELRVNPDQSRVVRLVVAQGRVKLKVRRFTSPSSRLEIETPAGISGVRGTEFAVIAQPSGKTAVAVREGAVNTSAQGQEVLVPHGFQNFTVPGEPPSPPVPLRDDPSLTYTVERSIVKQQRQLRLIGQVDPVNAVYFNGQSIDVDRTGRFVVNLPPVSFPKLNLVVETPLGKLRSYDLSL